MTGTGIYWKYWNRSQEMIAILTADITDDTREVAHDFTLSAVLMSAAVAGIHPNIHTTIFAKASPKTSFSWLNLVFVILSAILAEIIVSKIATILMVNHAINRLLKNETSVSLGSRIENNDTSTSWNTNSGKFLTAISWANVTIGYTMYPLLDRYPTRIPITLIGKIPGTALIKRFHINNAPNVTTNRSNAYRLTHPIWDKVIINPSITLSALGRPVNHRAPESCPDVIISATPTINPCNAVEGIRVIYLVILSNHTNKVHSPTTIASNGNAWYPYNNAKDNIKPDSAHVGHTIL